MIINEQLSNARYPFETANIQIDHLFTVSRLLHDQFNYFCVTFKKTLLMCNAWQEFDLTVPFRV